MYGAAFAEGLNHPSPPPSVRHVISLVLRSCSMSLFAITILHTINTDCVYWLVPSFLYKQIVEMQQSIYSCWVNDKPNHTSHPNAS